MDAYSFLLGGMIIFVVLLLRHFKETWNKLKLYMKVLLLFIFTNNTTWKLDQIPDPGLLDIKKAGTERRTIYFIRHGESTWNETFNRSKNPIFFIPRIIHAILHESYFFLTGQRDSWFIDAPLSVEGIVQAQKLNKYIFTQGVDNPTTKREIILSTIKGENKKFPTVLVCSNLRRAITTLVIGLSTRFLKDESEKITEKIVILPALQEISRNCDAISITGSFTNPLPSWLEKSFTKVNISTILSQNVDCSKNLGDNPIRGSNGLKRILEFANWVFQDTPDGTVTIVGGHSFWFRYFFQALLPRSSQHRAKKAKIANTGIVAFDLYKGVVNGNVVFRVHEESIQPVHLDFV
eukprot:TRINITY_DN3858_c0_g2_i12.p1 TRINITY_DN3858_c0_g2~~TRINITY_DN3858_c0_g2_i12.p1  ORF type:complete len:350 (+),score=60.23 TRINITY_DN3858_c0_g2_i12:61-1110(+)